MLNNVSDAKMPTAGAGGHKKSNTYDYKTLSDKINDAFRNAALQRGLILPLNIQVDGKIHRCDVEGKNGKKDGAYILHLDGIPAGGFQNHKDGKGWENWCADIGREFTPQENIAYKQKMVTMKREREAKKANHHAEAQEVAKYITAHAKPSTGGHPYEKRKQLDACPGVMRGDWPQRNKIDCLLIPLLDIDGTLWSVQAIFPEKDIALNRDKDFLSGGRKSGLLFPIGDLPEDVNTFFDCHVCEGFSTGMSIFMATEILTVLAFDASNILAVVLALKKKYPNIRIVIAGDDDKWKVDKDGKLLPNAGRINAEEAATKTGCSVMFPAFEDVSTKPTDFNDLARSQGLDEVRRQLLFNTTMSSVSVDNTWPEPQPIKQNISSPEPLPPQLIPEPILEWVSDIAHRMQCPVDYVASTAIVMMASLIGSGCGIRPKRNDDWLVIPNLWGCNIGSPSLMKSPAMEATLQPLSKLEKIANEQHDIDSKVHEADMLEYKARHKAITSNIEASANNSKKASSISIDAEKQRFIQLVEPTKPYWRRYKTSDATIEKLGELLSENKRGIVIIRDEIMGLLNGWEREDKSVDRAFYLEAWNGYGTYTTDRIGRGTIHTDNMCVSLFGNTQPDKILNYLLQAIRGDNDGLIQRLQILIYPEENKNHWQLIDEAPNLIAKNKAFKIAEDIANIDFAEIGATFDEHKEIYYFHFTPEAQEVFYEWLTDLEKNKLRGDDEDDMIIQHLAKYRSLMPSLALVFHIIDIVGGNASGAVSVAAAEKAAAWCDYLESHTRRVYSLVQNVRLKAASILADKIKSGKLPDKFTVRDIYRKGWAHLTDTKIVTSACDELVNLDWLLEEITPPSYQQKEKIEFLVNPKVMVQK